jgi:hypothetical protein
MSESRCFTAEFGGQCQLCGKWVERDTQAHFVNEKFAHDYCHEDRDGRAFKHCPEKPEDFGYEKPEPTFVVRGRRNHEKSCECGLIHAGECP